MESERKPLNPWVRLVLAALIFSLVAYLANQALEIQRAEDADHEAAEQYFRQLQE